MSEHTSNDVQALIGMGEDGRQSPFGMSYGKLMLWIFLFTDALTFGSFLISLGVARFSYGGAWPIGEETFDALPFIEGTYPLAYVALMTFILIISSVTMVLAVEAGHRMDKKGVIKWLLLTIVGGLFFLGSQAWEWSHFIHGTDFGRVDLRDGSSAIVKGEFGEIQYFEVITAGSMYEGVENITNENISATDKNLMHAFQHAAVNRKLSGNAGNLLITLSDGTEAKVHKAADQDMQLIVKVPGRDYPVSSAHDESTWLSGEHVEILYYEALMKGNVTYGANMSENEYGPQIYSNYFFFVTGFHGFHVTLGIMINIIIFINVLAGTYERRGHYEMVEKGGLYWHFVDLVWVFVFTFFYLI
ncbi:MAG: cytochrome c oxidase subunit 3 [Brumimicrobium sp.]